MSPSKLTSLLTLTVAFSAAGSLMHAAETADAKDQRITVNYQDPENFTDMKDGFYGTAKGMAAYQEEFAKYVTRTADRFLPQGQTMEITFTDVDMAGDFEPWRGSQASDVRIIKSIYPPRLKFNYVVKDADGVVVKDGSERLSDLSFQNAIGLNRQDTFYYEQSLIGDWLRKLKA